MYLNCFVFIPNHEITLRQRVTMHLAKLILWHSGHRQLTADTLQTTGFSFRHHLRSQGCGLRARFLPDQKIIILASSYE